MRSQMHILAQALCLGAVSSVEAISSPHATRANQPVDLGSFSNPGVHVQPRYRYWLPDASVDPELLADDIVQLGARGAGGIEFLPYYNYGGITGPAATDWNVYGFGTPAYRNVLKAALQACRDQGLLMDLSIGPQSGQGVPSSPDNPGLTWELVSYNVSIPENGIYTGQIPGWGEGELISAVTFAVLNSTNSFSIDPLFGTTVSSTEYVVSSASLNEVTDSVLPDGTVAVTTSSVEGVEFQILYASYARKSYARACIASSEDPQNIFQNGSFAVDHFSETGARVSTSFLEEHVLIDGIKELLMETGNYVWEDSVEIPSYTYWTPDLPDVFEQQHGYSMAAQLFLLSGNEGDQATSIGPVTFVTDAADEGFPFVADYRSTLAKLLGVYLKNLTAWTNEYLGLEFSQQVGYNLPVDMLEVVPSVDAPETETLSFSNNIDGFRQYCAPATLAGKPVISIELGAVMDQTYSQTWTDLLGQAKRAFVAGVNQVVIHGATYSHNYANTTWPGFASFTYKFAAQHSRHQPAWDVTYKQMADYLARVQFVLQSGVAKVDLVFWDKKTAEDAYPATIYTPTDLADAGYTYEYLSPENFVLPAASVHSGVLAPTQQAYRALILRANDTLTTDGVRYLVTYAQAGLPIIISGGVPSVWAHSNKTDIQNAESSLQDLLSLENVQQVPYEALAAAIRNIGITPRAQIASNGTWYTRWKENSNGDVYVFVYNDGTSSTGNISFEATGTPFFLDAWTGDQTPVAQYKTDGDGRIVIQFALHSTETKIVLFSALEQTLAGTHVVSGSEHVLGYTVEEDSVSLWAKVATSNTLSLTLSSGQIVPLQAAAEPVRRLENWSLVVEQWLAPEDLFDVEIQARKMNTTLPLPGPALPPWSDLGLGNVSGIGYYTNTLSWDSTDTNGAYLVIPPIAHGVILDINGKELPPLDPTNPTIDVTSYLVTGNNTIVLKVPTTLRNGLIPIWDNLLTGGASPSSTVDEMTAAGYGPQQYGVLGEVHLVPYQLVQIV